MKKNARFICNYDKKCDITGEQKRKNCQACRMARCEEAGMRKDRIMMHERRKNRRTEGKKERILPLPDTEPKVKVEAEEIEAKREATLRKRKRRNLFISYLSVINKVHFWVGPNLCGPDCRTSESRNM